MLNPFLKDQYNTPHGTIPFDQIEFEHYEEAMMTGMKLEDEAIDAIVANPETPTFQNTIEPVTDKTLSRVTTVFFNLLSANSTPQMEELSQRMSPLLTEHSNRIMMNDLLWRKVKYIYENHDALTHEQETLLKKVYDGFVRSGANLCPEDKERLAKMNTDLSMLTLQFQQNELHDQNDFVMHLTDVSDLDGLPETAVDAALAEAKARNLEGWVITLQAPSYTPFMQYSTNRKLRQQLYMAENTLCTHDRNNNLEIVGKIVNLRRQIAQLLGYSNFADYVLEHRMAQDTQHVYDLLDNLLDAYKPVAEREILEIRDIARRMEGEDFELMPWDFAFYSHKLKMERYNLDAEMLRPYFPLEQVKKGVFSLATRLYGITFVQNPDIPVYHPDVTAYDVMDKDGSFLAVLYADFHPRESKQSGAWMTSYREQSIDADGNDIRPIVSIVMNLTKPTPTRPSLLTLGEVETFLHEFGHALHGMFSRVRYESLSGTNVFWDFVELPSQFMENYAVEADFLNTFAFHYQTSEQIPADLIERIHQSRNFLCGYACCRQVSFGLLDMAYYTLQDPFAEDVRTFEHRQWQRAQVLPTLPETCMSVRFGHIMSGGYSAGYYSYKWAEVLDADAFSAFQEEGIFNPQTAERFRNNILAKGSTEHPMKLYVSFRGKEPSIDALLKRNLINA